MLSLRYRVQVHGLREVSERGTTGILFLPNHPALMDPILLMSRLHARFHPRALADRDQTTVNRIVSWITRVMGVIRIPDIKIHGQTVRGEVEAAIRECGDHLRAGGNLIMYPAGHLYRTRFEDVRGNSGVEEVLKLAPDARVVLVRTRGLWGSSFSMADGEFPKLTWAFRNSVGNLLKSGIFFMPRRHVDIQLHEPPDFPRQAGRSTINHALEAYYNEDGPPPAKFVAYNPWTSPRRRDFSDPDWRQQADTSQVPDSTRQRVQAKLGEVTGSTELRDDQDLALDLGMDSLARGDLLLWIGQEFGHPQPEGDAVRTVGDALLVASGEAIVTRPTAILPPPRRWFSPERKEKTRRLQAPEGTTLTDVFLAAAKRHPGRIILADQTSGAKSYRQLITGILALKPQVAALPGDTVGIMLPASVAANVAYWTALFAGKTPLMVNWTTGMRQVQHALRLAGAQKIVTAKALVSRLAGQGVDFREIEERFVYLEDIGAALTRRGKLRALLCSYFCWVSLRDTKPPETAAVLVTSGSESQPKAVPLTHANILTNIRDVMSAVAILGGDRLIGFLPPFHSFGLTVSGILPALTGFATVYHANPTEALTIAKLIESYRATVLLGTPTFLSGVLRATPGEEALASLRLIITGAEKCPSATYDALHRQCPKALILEGYGITECSPIVSVNRTENPQAGTIGKVLDSIDYRIVHPETLRPVQPGEQGLLIVRGASVFGGYLRATGAEGGASQEMQAADAAPAVSSPFVELDGHSWYRTGDLVCQNGDGILTFQGRLKRFVKIGGEMISLPAIEAALNTGRPAAELGDGPQMAVISRGEEGRPLLVLVTTDVSLDRESANQRIRSAGLSALHTMSEVRQVAEIPLLGNGKTDYRALLRALSG